ncbi:hypothetical protein GGR57DRAFT_347578 [Xylariaceae sp. FL1272]|nr:hypothetical protein GGR57DRAFT_347578 [Xylariaceae sp. FL1272]
MVQTRKERKAASSSAGIKLAQPDRSAPSEKTLLDIAQERKLFEQADAHPTNQRKARQTTGDDETDPDDENLSPTAERILDSLLWSVSLGMLHFTLDVLVHNQYAQSFSFIDVAIRAWKAFAVFFVLFYVLHSHPSSPNLLPGLPLPFQSPLRQAIFLVASTICGCYLIHITTSYGYIAIMKQSPPIACIWVWSVIELNLSLAVVSLAIIGGFFLQGGYSLKL